MFEGAGISWSTINTSVDWSTTCIGYRTLIACEYFTDRACLILSCGVCGRVSAPVRSHKSIAADPSDKKWIRDERGSTIVLLYTSAQVKWYDFRITKSKFTKRPRRGDFFSGKKI